jgi:hypothetical protein
MGRYFVKDVLGAEVRSDQLSRRTGGGRQGDAPIAHLIDQRLEAPPGRGHRIAARARVMGSHYRAGCWIEQHSLGRS